MQASPSGKRNISTSFGGRLQQFARNPTPIFTRSAVRPPTRRVRTSPRRFHPIRQATQHSAVPCSRSCANFSRMKPHLLLFRMNGTARTKTLTATSGPSGQPRSNRLPKRNGKTRKADFTWAYIGSSTPMQEFDKEIKSPITCLPTLSNLLRNERHR